MGLASTMPANIRRSGGSDAAAAAATDSATGSTPPLSSRQLADGSFAQGAPHASGYPRLQPQPQPQQKFSQALKPSNSNRDARCEQIIQNFYSKVAQVIAHLRAYSPAHTNSSYRYDSTYTDGTSAMLPPSRLMAASGGGQSGSPAAADASSASSSLIDVGASGRRINKWFNLDLEDIAEVKEEVKLWRHAVVGMLPSMAPLPPMIIEVCLDISGLSLDDELQVADIYGRPWNVDLELDPPESAHEYPMPRSAKGGRNKRQRAFAIVLESWRLDLMAGEAPTPAPDLPRVYKQAIVFFRSLYAFANLLPSVSLIRQLQGSDDGLALSCSFRVDCAPRAGVVGLDVSLTGTEMFLEQHSFQPVVTPMGTFALGVQYRRECLFSTSHVQRHQPLSSYADIGAIDNAYFTPTLSSRGGGGGAAESGSMLHRSVMLRRFGDTLSPTEPQRQFDYAATAAGRGSSSSERSRFGPTSPPKPKISTTRQPSSSSTGLGSGRWAVGIAPFKSPSLSDSPGHSLGSIAGSAGEPPHSAGSRRGDTAKLSPPESFDANRRRGHTFSHDGAMLGLALQSDAHQLVARLSDSPSSLGSNASGHSRGLSSSFGNRRASLVQRQHSILARPLAEAQGSGTASYSGEGHLLPRRHTVVEGQAGSLRQIADDAELQDIDAFIRMVDTRRPLGSYSRKDSAKGANAQRRGSALSGDTPVSGTATEKLVATTGPGSGRSPRVAGGESLRMYQDILSQFSTMSQDMQSSVVLFDRPLVSQAQRKPLPSMSEDAEADDGAAEGLSSSPFRRAAMPNPLRGSDRPAPPSRPVSMVSVNTPGAGLQASPSSLDSSSVVAAATAQQPPEQPYGFGAGTARLSVADLPPSSLGVVGTHVRSAAPGLDAKREHQLPLPVLIPRPAPNAPKRTATRQQLPPSAYLELERPETNDMFTGARPSEARMRGKSQPLLHATELSLPATPRVATPQPPGHTHTRAQPPTGIYRPVPLAPPLPSSPSQRPMSSFLGGPLKRPSPELVPLSHRSDFISSNHQLEALLSMADNTPYARGSPRSTPATPMLGTMPVHRRGSNAIADSSDTERLNDRLRSNFPPLSFIVPRHRMDPYAPPPHSQVPTSGPQHAPSKRFNDDSEHDENDCDDDEELMFQMESSTC
ncbi:autophagy protein 13 [Coemansia spiralis]|uniref:Autophagy-related protein 13 n=1 Tax=Coemansia spiralis TaxID=417178 RepID=A0A9W8GGY4_9FUNG|nr:autophagy protein 13 [Coemansia spiralis]